MALIDCHECSREISDKAPNCPHCGAPKEELELVESHYPNGQLQEKGTKKDGEWDGPYESYSEDGHLKSRGTYKSGKRCGEWIEYDGTTKYPPCSGDPKPSGPTKPESVATKESVTTKDEPFNNVVAIAVGAFAFQIARTLGISWGALTAIFFVIPTYLLTKYGKKQSPQVYAGIIALCFAVLVIAVMGN